MSVISSYGQLFQKRDIESLMRVKSTTAMVLKDSIPLLFDTYHTQGLTKIGDYFFLTGVDVHRWPKAYKKLMGKFDRDVGVGNGYIMKFNLKGELISKVSLGHGSMYHPGGIDFDGENIWVPVCEYRPFGRSLIYRLNPITMAAQEVFIVDDAIGAIIYNRDENELIGMNWDAVQFYKWKKVYGEDKWDLTSVSRNDQHFIHYQDGQYIGQGLMLCSGLNSFQAVPNTKDKIIIGGLQLLDVKTYSSRYSIPIELWSKKGRVMTGNPFCAEVIDGEINCYFVPDDNHSILYTYRIKNL
ncbi:MAG TPA: hypothetical protein DDY75_01525 [Sphingobacterium sp.]|nr:hypothetical protein [Sphingobacterium sp.]